MKSDFTYDLVIIGGGISACVFASKYLKNNITKKIALVSQLMNSEDPKEDAIMILKDLSHEN